MTEKKRYRATFSSDGPLQAFRIRIPEIIVAPNIYKAYEKAKAMERRKHYALVEVREIET